MTGGNWLIIIVGIVICFMGICLKKIFEAILGFVWGFSFAYIMLFIMALAGSYGIRNMDDATALMWEVIIALMVAALSVLLERVFMAVRAFLITFLITMLIFATMSYDADFTTAVVIAVIVGLIFAGIMWAYHKYAFIIECAITGSIMINHVGLLGGSDQSRFMSNMLYGYSRTDNSTAIFITIVVAIAGIVVQSMILQKIESGALTSGNKEGITGINGEKFTSILALLPDSNIQKANIAAVRQYEKYLIIAPVIAFFVMHILKSMGLIQYTEFAWEFRYYVELILTGIFEGALIYSVVYYETKVSGIYQLLWLSWVPAEILYHLKNHYIFLVGYGFRHDALFVCKYLIIWGLLMALDYTIKNEKAKITAMCVVTILMVNSGISFLMYGYFSFYVNIYNSVQAIALVSTVLILIYMRKNKKDTACLHCGTEIITGDLYCRNCGKKY